MRGDLVFEIIQAIRDEAKTRTGRFVGNGARFY